jgi:hypothetical protein
MNKSEILSAFNNHIQEFFKDVIIIYPDDDDIKVANSSLSVMRKANPRLVIEMWKEYMLKYKKEINEGNIDFFINKNYADDLRTTSNSSVILEKIDTLREPMKKMDPENLKKTIKYVQNLTKLCEIYYKN